MDLDIWELQDEFSLHEAACLIAGENPAAFFYLERGDSKASDHAKAMFITLKKAILKYELLAFVVNSNFQKSDPIEALIALKCFDWDSRKGDVVICKNDIVSWLELNDLRPVFFFPDEINIKGLPEDQRTQTVSIDSKPLDPRKETTLNCLIAVLTKKLNYSPDDADTVGMIYDLLEKQGVHMDKKTIRTNIRSAFSSLNEKRE